MNQEGTESQVPILVTLEGNLAAGKSTLLTWFEHDTNIEVLREPLEKWEDIGNKNLLELKYLNSPRWEFTFQIYSDLTRVVQLRDTQYAGTTRIQERSLISAHKVFAALQEQSGNVSQVEAEILRDWYSTISNKSNTVLTVPDLILYLKVDPVIAFDRMKMRNRGAESTVTLTYLQKVHERHELVFGKEAHLLPCPVVVLDGNIEEENLAQVWVEAVSAIEAVKSRRKQELDSLEDCMRSLEKETEGK